MSLRWKEFERELRPQLDPLNPLRRWDWLRRLGRLQMNALVGRAIYTALVFIALTVAALNEAPPDGYLKLMPLIALCFAIGVAHSFAALPVSLPEYLTWWMLPLTEEDIFKRVRRIYGCFAILSFLEFLPQYVLALKGSAVGASLFALAILAALAQTLVSLAFMAVVTRSKVAEGFGLLIGAASLFCFLKEYRQPWNPFAWTQEMLGPGGRWLFAAPILALLATLPWSLRRCRQAHADLAYRVTPVVTNGRPAMPRPTRSQHRPPPLSRETLANAAEQPESSWNRQGVLPRLVSGLLRPRERHIAEAIFGVRPLWDKLFFYCVGLLIVFLISSSCLLKPRFTRELAFVLGLPPHFADYFMAAFAFMAAFTLLLCFLLAVFLFKIWAAPEQVGFQSEYRLLPITHWDISLVLAKVMAVFALLLVPLAVILSLSPLCLLLEAEKRANFQSLPLLPLFAWLYSFAVSLPAQRLTGRYFRWRDFLVFPKLILLHGALLALAAATFFQPKHNALYLAAFVALSLSWFAWEGRRYWKRA